MEQWENSVKKNLKIPMAPNWNNFFKFIIALDSCQNFYAKEIVMLEIVESQSHELLVQSVH